MASDILDRVGMVITDIGAGDVTANVLISNRFNTPQEAGAVNAGSYWWMLEEDNDYQIFEGVWTLATTKVARTTTWQSKIGGVHAAANMSLAGNATLRSITPAEAFNYVLRTDKAQAFSAAQQAQGRGNVYAAPFDALAANGIQINGSLDISQEFGGTAITGIAAAMNLCDMWSVSISGSPVVTAQQVSDAPPGYSKSLKISVTTAQASLAASDNTSLHFHNEGYRVARLNFGSIAAQPVTIGFWVKAHRAGLYSGVLRNSAATRSYPFAYTINAADTWEWKSFTAPGETTGVWDAINGNGLSVFFCLAGGSSVLGTANAWAAASLRGAAGTTNGIAATTDTFQITGLTVLPGTELPSSDRAVFLVRPADQELALCRRYLQLHTVIVEAPGLAQSLVLPVQMRAAPTITGGGAGFAASVNDANTLTCSQTTRASQNLILRAQM